MAEGHLEGTIVVLYNHVNVQIFFVNCLLRLLRATGTSTTFTTVQTCDTVLVHTSILHVIRLTHNPTIPQPQRVGDFDYSCFFLKNVVLQMYIFRLSRPFPFQTSQTKLQIIHPQRRIISSSTTTPYTTVVVARYNIIFQCTFKQSSHSISALFYNNF